MRVHVAKHAGVCYGVERSLRKAHEAAESGGPAHTLGPLIHNPQAVAGLEARGIGVATSLDEVASGTLIIRTHGVDPAIIAEASRRGLDVVDATCPFVSTAHQVAEQLRADGYAIVIVGEAEHPEVAGILAHAGETAIVVEEPADLPARLASRRIGVVVQTTQSLARLTAVVDALLPRASELRVHNTICSATEQRQHAAEELARQVDVMIVVGGRNSGNTGRLVEVCRSVNPRVHHVETADELQTAWFEGAAAAGVTAGASTLDEQMRGVISAIEGMGA